MDTERATWDSNEFDSPENSLDHVAVSTLTTNVNALVIASIDTIVHSDEHVPSSMVAPIVRRIKDEYLSPATFYALLASRMHFQQEFHSDPSIAKLWRTRSHVCEEVALRLIAEYELTDLAQCLVYEFYPLADGSPLETIPTWLRVSALELAIKSRAKRLLAHPVFVNIIAELWDGHLVLDPYVHKVHRSDQLTTKYDLWRLMNARKGVLVRYDFETTTVFKPSRLRVPKYRDWLKALNLAVLIGLYVALMGPSSTPQSFGRKALECFFQLWLVAFILDEIQVFLSVGLHLYFMTLWSICDFATMMLGISYLLIRDISPFLVENPEAWASAAFDFLAVAGVTLIPRIFAVLEASVGFSRTVISVRKMITELIWCWVAIAMFSVGFWAALAHFGRGVFSRTKVFYDLVQIMFGFTPAVWQTWTKYPSLGAMILFLYLFMAEFVVTTIVTAALSAKIVETKDNSIEEYHFLNAVRAELRIKSERQVLYFYSQPFNVLVFFPLPILRYMLPMKWYLRINRTLLKLTHWHIFLAIYVYERLTSVIHARRAKSLDLMHKRIKQHLRNRSMLKRVRVRPTTASPRNESRVSPEVPDQYNRAMALAAEQNNAVLRGNIPASLPNNAIRTPVSEISSPFNLPYYSGAGQVGDHDLSLTSADAVGTGGGSMREAKFELVEGLLNTPSSQNRVSSAYSNRLLSRPSLLRSRQFSFETVSDNGASIAPSEEYMDLQESFNELRASNLKLEESYASLAKSHSMLEESHVRLEKMLTKVLEKLN